MFHTALSQSVMMFWVIVSDLDLEFCLAAPVFSPKVHVRQNPEWKSPC